MGVHEESSLGIRRDRLFVKHQRPFGSALLLVFIPLSFLVVFFGAISVLGWNQLGPVAVRVLLTVVIVAVWIGWVALVMRRQRAYSSNSARGRVPVVATDRVVRVPFQERTLPRAAAYVFAEAMSESAEAVEALIAQNPAIRAEIADMKAAGRARTPDELAVTRGIASLLRLCGCTPDDLEPIRVPVLNWYESGSAGSQPRIWILDDAVPPHRWRNRASLGDGRFAWRARTSEPLPITKSFKIAIWWLAVAPAIALGAWAWQRGSLHIGLAGLKWIGLTWVLIGGLIRLFRPSWWLILDGDSLILSRSKRGHTIDEKRWSIRETLVILHRQYNPGALWFKPSPTRLMNWRFCVPGEPWVIDVPAFRPEGTVLERPIREFEEKTEAARNG